MSGIVLGVIGTGLTVVIVIVGATWRLGGRFGKVEAKLCVVEEKLKNLPTNKDLNEKLKEHQRECPARSEYSTASGFGGN